MLVRKHFEYDEYVYRDKKWYTFKCEGLYLFGFILLWKKVVRTNY